MEAELAKAYAAGLRSARTSWARGFDCDIVIHRGAGAYEARRRDGAHRVARRQARAAAHQAAVPGGRRASTTRRPRSTTSRRCATCRRSCTNGAEWFTHARAREERRPEALLRQRPRQEAGRLRSDDERRRSRELIFDHAGGIRDGHKLKAVIPGGSSVPILLPDQLDIPASFDDVARRPGRCSARPASSSWTRPPAWSGWR